MRTLIHSKSTIDFANYYAVELLDVYFGKKNPKESEISKLEKNLQKPSIDACAHYECIGNKKYLPKALILSPDTLEQNTLMLMFCTRGINVDRVYTKEDFFKLFTEKQSYGVVIISEHFKSIGLNFLSLYFQSSKHKPFLIYLGNGLKTQYVSMGFDARLSHPFFTKDLIDILPHFNNYSLF
ncbi:MAG: hypothetical protein K0S08_707 [Gammaproteobacteria bacterium]|jgi:hypothetical protein|nr:hypothetical protein [Gammaproteobacteria bacterium]